MQRDREAVRRSSQPPTHQNFACFHHLAADERLESIEIELAIGIADAGPALEELIDLAVEGVVATGGPRHDAGANDVIHQDRDGLRGMRIVPHKIAHPVAKKGAGLRQLGVSRGSCRVPAIGAPPARRTLIAPGQGLEGLSRGHPS